MRTEPVDLIFYVIFGIVGFGLRVAFESYNKHKNATRLDAWRINVKELEDRLSLFFWPLFFRLKRGDEAWKSNNLRSDTDDPQRKQLADTFDAVVIMENHKETKEIIQKYYYLAGGDKKLEQAILGLLHHIDVYISLREAGLEHDPIWVGSGFPDEIVELVEERLYEHQASYDQMLKDAKSFI